MTEMTSIYCADCDFSAIVRTTESSAEPMELIDRYKLCPSCGGKRMLQSRWRDANGQIGTCG